MAVGMGTLANRYCLVDDVGAVYDTAILFGVQQPEPGPYVIVQVWPHATGASGSAAGSGGSAAAVGSGAAAATTAGGSTTGAGEGTMDSVAVGAGGVGASTGIVMRTSPAGMPPATFSGAGIGAAAARA